MESQNQSMVVSSVNSSGGFAFLGNIDRFGLTRNVLIAYVYITYIDLENFEFFNIKTIGVLVYSYILLVPIHQIPKEVMKNPTLRFRYTPFETKHRKDNIFSLDLNKVENILYNQREESNNINLFFRYVSEESSGDSSAQKKLYFPDSKWALIILENPIGEFLLNYNLLELKYFKLNDTYGTSANRKMKIYYSTIIKIDGREDVETSSTVVDSKILWFNSKKFYIAFSKDLKFFNMDGIVYIRSFQIIGIYEGGKSPVYDNVQIKRMINKELDNNLLANNYNNILKSYAGVCKENELKYIEIEFLNNSDIKDLQVSIDKIKKYFFSEVGTLSLELNHFSSFLEHFNCYERLLTLFVAGPIVLRRLCQELNINNKTLDKNLLVKKLISDDMNDRYNLESLEIIDYNLKENYFQTILEAFYFSKNLLFLDLSGSSINLEKALVLSNYLYIKKNLKKLNLARTGMGLTELFVVLQGLIEGQINKGQTSSSLYSLNLSQNNFYINKICNLDYEDNLILKEILKFDFPNDLSFLKMIFDIKSLKELFLQDLNFKHKDDIISLFKEVTKSMLHDEADEEEDSDEEKTDKDNQEKMIRLYKHNTQYGIKLLNFSNNNLKKESMTAISNYLSIAGSVEEIIFTKCGIDDNMTGILCTGLLERNKYSKSQDCLKILDLSKNLISWKGANKIKEFISSLKKNPDDVFNKSNSNRNEWLDLSSYTNQFSLILDNNMSFSEGVAKICEGISINSPALSLSFKNVGLKNIDLEAIYNVLICGYPIKYLSLAKNKLDDSSFEMFRFNKALASSKCLLQTLNIHSNRISMDGIYNLLSGFQGTSAYTLKKCKFYIICDPFEIKSNFKKENKSNERLSKLNTIQSVRQVENLKNYEIIFDFVQFCKRK